uniref:Uncharacterized protein n=1 Tax=Anguilla anguilla TaxID=7936 RepID=A0A0E9TP36_ANGAN
MRLSISSLKALGPACVFGYCLSNVGLGR